MSVTAPLDIIMAKKEECIGALEDMRTLGESDHSREDFIIGNRET